MPEGAPQHETVEPDYEAIGRQALIEMGIEDPTFGSIAVTTGDAKGVCVGTMAEAVGRHGFVRESLKEIVEEARADNIGVEEAMLKDRTFKKTLMQDEATGELLKVGSAAELKKN